MNLAIILVILLDAWTDTLMLRKLAAKIITKYLLTDETVAAIEENIRLRKSQLDESMIKHEEVYNDFLQSFQELHGSTWAKEFADHSNKVMTELFDELEEEPGMFDYVRQHREKWFSSRPLLD